MTIMEMLGQSGVLTLLGMGVVFGFLTVMVICMTITGKIVHALGLDKDLLEPAKPAARPAPPPTAAGTDAATVTAVISAAVHEYRKTENR